MRKYIVYFEKYEIPYKENWDLKYVKESFWHLDHYRQNVLFTGDLISQAIYNVGEEIESLFDDLHVRVLSKDGNFVLSGYCIYVVEVSNNNYNAAIHPSNDDVVIFEYFGE